MKQNDENKSEFEDLMQHMQACEKLISNCSMDQFSDLRFELKQLKEKLRHIHQMNRLK